jgi:hypothetical protein
VTRPSRASIEQRIKRLEAATLALDLPTCIVVLEGPDESTETAVARYRTEHPVIPDKVRYIVFVSGFSGAHHDRILGRRDD